MRHPHKLLAKAMCVCVCVYFITYIDSTCSRAQGEQLLWQAQEIPGLCGVVHVTVSQLYNMYIKDNYPNTHIVLVA